VDKLFHPLVWRWFSERFSQPTAPQEIGWRHICARRNTLIAAPTGSGKTLAAFLWSIDNLFRQAVERRLEDRTHVIYISPLKALGNDIEKNLREPLAGILASTEAGGLEMPEIRVAVRSGDTPAKERQWMLRKPPHILITTPESLYILLTAERSRRILRQAETVIVDEIHAVADSKRGSHLALSLERLDALTGRPLQRIGLSATQRPIEEIARFLVGTERIREDGTPDCVIVDMGHRRRLDLSIEIPEQELGPIATQAVWSDIYDRITAQVKAHRTTLVFVNTRRLVERVAHQLTSRLGEGKVGAHHGSLSRKSRLEVEEGLKSGALPVVVATASLELGIDIGQVDLVCHIGSPRTLATLFQRVGRSGHALGAIPKGIFYPLTRDDLVECAAGIRAVRSGHLDRLTIPEKALDIMAQQMVAAVASLTLPAAGGDDIREAVNSGIGEEELFSLIKKAYPYRNLEQGDFEQVLDMLSEGISSRTGRRSAYIHRDRVHGRLRARRGARLSAITNGGAIPDTADYDVIEFPDETFLGKVNEDFAIESLAGDIFLLGNKSWRIRRVGSGKVWVEDAQGLPPSIPFWLGEAPGRTAEFSAAVSELRHEIAARQYDPSTALRWLVDEANLAEEAGKQLLAYIKETRTLLGCVPTTERVVAERFFDEAGGMQLVLHAPFGGRINRAWGLALRKCFCVTFDYEIQAAATDDGIVLSLGERHSFPLDEVFSWLRPSTLEKNLTQAVLASPMFTNRWRWNATRSLALQRYSGGRKVPVALQRIRGEELLAAVFPAQVMCQDNRSGPIEVPDHPLVNETIHDCLQEAMDLNGLKEIIGRIERGKTKTVAVETPVPSPMAHEILNANPYAFLDDAPLEERRARAVALRRTSPDLGQTIGALSQEAIQEVRAQVWPEIRDADELHDFLLNVCVLPLEKAKDWLSFAESLMGSERATIGRIQSESDGSEIQTYIAAERLEWVRAVFSAITLDPEIVALLGKPNSLISEEVALGKILRGWMEVLGPIYARDVALMLGLSLEKVKTGLLALEADGVVLRGRFTPNRDAEQEAEWCERSLLARIHRLTLGQLRREIEPVSPADFVQFLFCWQHVEPETQLKGQRGILEVIGQLQGLELPAPAWEQRVLPARICDYDPADLEQLCLGGMISWGRLKNVENPVDFEEEKFANLKKDAGTFSKKRTERRRGLSRVAPIAFVLREDLSYFVEPLKDSMEAASKLSVSAREVAGYLERCGASFLTDIARGTGLLKTRTEGALWELVAHGLVTGDGIAGLRVLLLPEAKRRGRRGRLRVVSGSRAAERLIPAGRWSLWGSGGDRAGAAKSEKTNDYLARQLLRRYGVVMRELIVRETRMPPWRTLLEIYRRLEARGEIRGGRFIRGFAGEQFALPEAIDILRSVRRSQPQSEAVMISSADPLNLVGILTPGSRVSPYSSQTIAYSNGVPIEIGPLGAVLSRLQLTRSSPPK
jgi:ATP-dependent Lhr-like helicase